MTYTVSRVKTAGLLLLLSMAGCASGYQTPSYDDPARNPALAQAIRVCESKYPGTNLSAQQLGAISACDDKAREDIERQVRQEYDDALAAKAAAPAHEQALRIIAAVEADRGRHNPFGTGLEYYYIWGPEHDLDKAIAFAAASEVGTRFPIRGPEYFEGKDQFIVVLPAPGQN